VLDVTTRGGSARLLTAAWRASAAEALRLTPATHRPPKGFRLGNNQVCGESERTLCRLLYPSRLARRSGPLGPAPLPRPVFELCQSAPARSRRRPQRLSPAVGRPSSQTSPTAHTSPCMCCTSVDPYHVLVPSARPLTLASPPRAAAGLRTWTEASAPVPSAPSQP